MAELVYSDKPRTLWSYLPPAGMARNLWANRSLAWSFARREIEARYKAQRLGLAWAVITPLVLLAVYTFIFGVVFPNKWGKATIGGAPLGQFALSLFVGLLIFGVFRETAARAPGLIVGRPNYVKRVVFPLEVLAISEVLIALFNFSIGALVWLVGFAVIEQRVPPPTILLTPALLAPLVLTALGVSWLLSSLGVFLRDLGNVVELVIAVLFFMTPIFYSIENVPERVRGVLALNPLAQVIEDVRRVAIAGELPGAAWYGVSMVVSAAFALFAYAAFMKSKRAFADVI